MADEQRIREVAQALWEADGRPEGQQQRYREMAKEIVATENSAGRGTNLEEVGEIVSDEPSLLEEGLPLDEDESIIEENRLPLEAPDGESDSDASSDRNVARDVPVFDRGGSGSTSAGHEPTPDSPPRDKGRGDG